MLNSGFKSAFFKLVSSRVVFRQQHKDVSIKIQIAVRSIGVKSKVRPFDTNFRDYAKVQELFLVTPVRSDWYG